MKLKRKIDEVAGEVGVPTDIILRFISYEWISPADAVHQLLDEEDIARIRLIRELQDLFGVNDEAVPIILHLVDQLNCLHVEIKHSR